MLVNGGGSVTLQFQRIPFAATTRTVFVPWNEIVVLDPPVIMSVGGSQGRSGEEGKEGGQEPCLQHDIRLLKPVVMSSWLPGMVGARPQDSLVFGESQVGPIKWDLERGNERLSSQPSFPLRSLPVYL